MMLRELKFKAVYRTESDSLLDDFYIPALSRSIRYDRAVGFFSTAMLSYAAQGVAAFAQNGGKMRLIFGGEIEGSEMTAIEDGYRRRTISDRIGEHYVNVIENIADALAYRRRSLRPVEQQFPTTRRGRLVDLRAQVLRRGPQVHWAIHPKLG